MTSRQLNFTKTLFEFRWIFFIFTNKYAYIQKLMQDLFRYMQNGRKIRVGFVQDAYCIFMQKDIIFIHEI